MTHKSDLLCLPQVPQGPNRRFSPLPDPRQPQPPYPGFRRPRPSFPRASTGSARLGHHPQFHRLVLAARDDVFAVGCEGDAPDLAAVGGPAVDLLAAAGLPEADGAVVAAGDDAL